MKVAKSLLNGTMPKGKIGSGRKWITSGRTDCLLKQEVLASPLIIAASLKKHPEHLEGVSIWTIQNQLKKDLGLSCRHAAKKSLLTNKLLTMKKKLNFT